MADGTELPADLIVWAIGYGSMNRWGAQLVDQTTAPIVHRLDLATMSLEEIMAYWDLWFRQAQATNDEDQWVYSHGVFDEVPESART